MKILFHGCSITWGDELEDRENERYSKLVCDKLGVEENNLANCGNSNDRIVRETIEYLKTSKVDVVVMQFTVHSRIEWFDKEGWIHRFTPQLTSTHGKLKLKGIAGRDDLRERMYSAGKWFYRFVYGDIFGVENMWKNILLFDAYCKANDIKFIPLLADHYAEPIRRPEKFYRVGHTGWWKPLCEGIPVVRIHEGILKESPSPMFLPKNHPSPLGHKEIANKVIELIEHI